MPEGTQRAVALAMTSRHLAAAHPDGSISVFELPTSNPAVVAKPSSSKGTTLSEDDDDDDDVIPPEVHLVVRSTASELQKHNGEQQDTRHRKGQAWRAYQSPFSTLKASPEGSVFAAAGAWGIHLFRFPVTTQTSKAGASISSTSATVPSPLHHLGKVMSWFSA